MLPDCVYCWGTGHFNTGKIGLLFQVLFYMYIDIKFNCIVSYLHYLTKLSVYFQKDFMALIRQVGCKIVAVIVHFTTLATFFWTNIMAWDIYKTFGQRTVLSHIRPTGSRSTD